MTLRAAIILLKEDQIALIERHRQGVHYYTFPGGHVDEGETPEQAAMRETMEELGLKVSLKKLVARAPWKGNWQNFYLAEIVEGIFGTGRGEEMTAPRPERGTYNPVWMPITDLLKKPVKPWSLSELVQRCVHHGWPENPVLLPES